MSKRVDLELKQAFIEVQKKIFDTSRKLKLCTLQIKRHESKIASHKKVLNDLNELSDDTNVYESVGRAFIASTLNNSKEDVKNLIKFIEDKISQIENKKKQLESSLLESEHNLREMVAKKKDCNT